MREDAFWLVWNPQGRNPTRQHEYYQQAVSEAERLARNNPGETFIVMESVCARVVDSMKKIDMTPNNRDCVPF